MGEDKTESPKWKNSEKLISDYQIIVYPRTFEGKKDSEYLKHQNIHQINAPIIELSATEIRK